MISQKKSTTNSVETASKRAFRTTGEATGDLIGNNITDKITSASKSTKKLYSQNENELEIPKERYKSPEKDNKLIAELRLV